MEESTGSGSERKIGIVAGKFVASDGIAFSDFLRNKEPPRSLSQCTGDDAVEFLRRLPSDKIETVAISLGAADFNGDHKANPFRSSAVTTFLKERVKEKARGVKMN
ncbi:unnamed protein product [Arabis nemorensis]|uniref:Uncharacterized protein n=1 Tax=Arabis nemorensis TaxID=586526 RepID=A0A565CFM3_9BRAS|nr:unnamed protein product [Arabis nemorensis]